MYLACGGTVFMGDHHRQQLCAVIDGVRASWACRVKHGRHQAGPVQGPGFGQPGLCNLSG
eukprot:816555-Pelagomonas_calceolata.AAC.2